MSKKEESYTNSSGYTYQQQISGKDTAFFIYAAPLPDPYEPITYPYPKQIPPPSWTTFTMPAVSSGLQIRCPEDQKHFWIQLDAPIPIRRLLVFLGLIGEKCKECEAELEILPI